MKLLVKRGQMHATSYNKPQKSENLCIILVNIFIVKRSFYITVYYIFSFENGTYDVRPQKDLSLFVKTNKQKPHYQIFLKDLSCY